MLFAVLLALPMWGMAGNNSIWTYDCYAFYTYSNNQWVVSAVMK